MQEGDEPLQLHVVQHRLPRLFQKAQQMSKFQVKHEEELEIADEHPVVNVSPRPCQFRLSGQ